MEKLKNIPKKAVIIGLGLTCIAAVAAITTTVYGSYFKNRQENKLIHVKELEE